MVLADARLSPGDWKQDEGFEPLADEKVIGLNNLLSIAWLSQALTLAAPVGRIIVGDGWGTGFLIGTDMLMTNHHVLPSAAAASSAILEFNYQTDWAGNLEPTRRYTFDTTHFHTNDQFDYTMVRVLDNPGDVFGHIDLARRAQPNVNDFVSIIQHPNGGPKQICITDNKVSAVFDDRLQYSTDTEPGSSGSPVFNQQWELVGLHHRGGSLVAADGTRSFTNEGMLLSSILRDAATFLALPDALYDLAFSDLRAMLVKFIEDGQSPPDALAADMLRTRPRFPFALDEWSKLYSRPDEKPAASAARAGIAVGAALRLWARADGHESIKSAAVPTPPPAPGLAELVVRLKGASAVPRDLYDALLVALSADWTVAGIADASEQTTGAMARSFLTAIALGAKAFDGSDARSSAVAPNATAAGGADA